jgi:dATP pyrophosphohydrolase
MLLRRTANPELGLENFWQGVTGGLEESEDLIKAARRELAEETGFVPSSIEKIEYSYTFPMRDEWKEMYPHGVNEIVEHVFIAFIDGNTEPILSHEHETWKWYDVNEALLRLKYPGNIEALKRCSILLESHLCSK